MPCDEVLGNEEDGGFLQVKVNEIVLRDGEDLRLFQTSLWMEFLRTTRQSIWVVI